MKALWNQIKFQKDLFLMGGAVMLGMFVFGTILHDFLVTGDDEVTSVFCMGTFMATIVMFMMMFFFAGVHMVQWRWDRRENGHLRCIQSRCLVRFFR